MVWDTEDTTTDVFLDAGLSIAKALSTQAKSHNEEVGADVKAIEESVLVVEKQIKELDEITIWAKTNVRKFSRAPEKHGIT